MHCIFDFPKGIPYDYSCPVVQEFINRRLCSTCGLYLASLKELASHKKLHKENEEQSQRKENDPPPPQIFVTQRMEGGKANRYAALQGGEGGQNSVKKCVT